MSLGQMRGRGSVTDPQGASGHGEDDRGTQEMAVTTLLAPKHLPSVPFLPGRVTVWASSVPSLPSEGHTCSHRWTALRLTPSRAP